MDQKRCKLDVDIDAVKLNMLSVLTLRNDKTSQCYDILNKKTHIVARTGFNGDLEISDTSVSRFHAEISLIKKTINSKVKLVLEVVDKKSKFGTFVNSGIELNERIESNCPIILELSDRIRFGIMGSIWTVVKYSIVACPSTLKMVDKDILKNSLSKIGAQVIREWSEQCTHLCMNSVTVTEKVLLCLASAKSIVSVKYFVDICKALLPGSSIELPFCMDYKPNLVEKILNPNSVSLNVNNKRKTLFYGKIFICSSVEQLNRLSKIVDAAGGKIINYFDGYITDDDILHCNKHIVMQKDPHNTENNDKYQIILDKLEVKNRRPIPESDIGLSIIYSSTEKHCNPNYNVSLVNLHTQSSTTTSQASVILALETEVLTVGDSEIYTMNTVPDSLYQTQNRFKRPLEVIMDSEDILMPKKRALLSDEEKKSNVIKVVEENFEPFKKVIDSTQSSSYHIIKSSNHDNEKNGCSSFTFSKYDKEKNHSVKTNEEDDFESYKRVIEPTPSNSNTFKLLNYNNEEKNSCIKTRVEKNVDLFKRVIEPTPSSSNKNKDTNLNNTNDCHSNLIDKAVIAKRKLPSVCSMFDNEEEDDLFNYMDIDEIEEHPKKKSRKELAETVFLPILPTTSNNKCKQSKSVEPTIKNALDPNFIMNLLAEAKGTGQFIDASKLPDKSSINMIENTEHDNLLDSVIVETVKMVVTKPIQIQNIVQGSHSSLQNFKKFKRKGPVMRIPHIVPLKLSQI